MPQVTIRRCPVCPTIRARTDEIFSVLNKEPGMTAKVVDGEKGEFTVEVHGRVVARKHGEMLPTAEEVAAVVQQESLAGNVV